MVPPPNGSTENSLVCAVCSAFLGLWGKQQKEAHVQRQSESLGQTVQGNLESSRFGYASVLFLS